MKLSKLLLFFPTLLLALPAAPQQIGSNAAASSPTAVPPLIPYSGVVSTVPGVQPAASASITFLIYKDEQGGEPLFAETQTVAIDAAGHYKAQLGATLTNGIPIDLFATGEARWLEVQVAGETPQPRALLASVPYALKAADAATLGGLPPSAFALARPTSEAASTLSPEITPTASNVTTPGGLAGYVPEFSSTSSIVNSPLFASGAKVGIGTAAPLETLDVRGTAMSSELIVNGITTLGGAVELAPLSFNATPATGYNSQLLKIVGSAYNSASKAIVNPRFVWQTTVAGNNTPAPSATLDLLSSTTAAVATPTGFYFNPNGTIHFATGQTFPGSALTGVINATSYDLGGSSFATGSTSARTAYLGFAGNPGSSGTNDTGVGYGALSSNTTGLGNTAIGVSALFKNTTGGDNTAIGLDTLSNNTTGNTNTASGAYALASNTNGLSNTAIGYSAMYNNTIGSSNTAVGDTALQSNLTGSNLTAVGLGADVSSSTAIGNATALGANAVVGQSNSLVLGQTTPGSPGVTHVNVGIGTATPSTTMEISVNAPNSLGPTLLLSNPGGTTASGGPGQAAMASIDFKTYLHASTQNSPTSRIEAVDDNYGNYLAFQAKIPGSDSSPLATAVEMEAGPGAYTTIETPIIVTFYSGVPPATPTIAELGGNVDVDGTLSADSKEFKIDHPSDPANKYLAHTSVESSEMMNIYSGNVTTDELGIATVTLPDWFEAENGDFRYQLTTIGRDAHAWVSQEVSNHQFKIATNATFVKVSWQITAVRQDAYAKAHPLVVEQSKSAQERGFYRHPELYGQTEERSLQWARHPQQMQRMKAQRAANAPSTSAEVSR